MDIGYIKLYRKVTSSFVWTNSNMLKLWMLCLMKASHKGSRFIFNGQEVELSSGQFVTGRAVIEKEFNEGVPRDQQVVGRTLWRWLKKFENEQMLSITSTTKYSVISIINWDVYQGGDQQVSNNRPSTVQQVSTYKNDKNDKNDKNKDINVSTRKKRVYEDDDPNKKLAVILLKRILQNQNIKEPDLNDWANTIRLTIEGDKRTGKEVQEMIIWATQNDFWKSVVLSPSSLRRNFDKMSAQKENPIKPNGFGKKVRKETLPDHITNPVVDTEEDPAVKAELEQRLAEYLKKKEAMASEE